MSTCEVATTNNHLDREFSPFHTLISNGTQGSDGWNIDCLKSWKGNSIKGSYSGANAGLLTTLAPLQKEEALSETVVFSERSKGVSPTLPVEKYTSATANCTFLASKKWEGVVLSIGEETFMARLSGLASKTTVEEEAELPISDVTEDDRELLQEGAFFFFSVGYITRPYGTRERSSRIRFRRLPVWSPDEILDANIRAKSILKNLGAE